MSKKKKRRPKKSDVWKYRIGDMTAYERTDRGRAIWTRVGPNAKGEYEQVKPLCGPIRRADGSLDPELETEARVAFEERVNQRAGGAPKVDPKAPLTLRAACRLAVDPKTGKYIGKKGWDKDVKSNLERICQVPFTVPGQPRIQTLGDLPVDQLRHAHYQALWRWMMEEHVKSGRFGLRAIEMACSALRAAMSWLELEEKIAAGIGMPARKWKAAMQKDWTKITEKPIAAPKRPRYTQEEKAKLFAASAMADPRIRLAFELGAELRLGQVIARTRRSEIAKYADPFTGTVHDVGVVIVHGAGKKKGADLVLTDDQRAALVEAMTTGYLSELERAYQAREIEDYLLIPGGYMAKGKAQVKHAMQSMGDRAARTYWYRLEEAAGVEHVKGRGWYGMRRRQADDAEDETPDKRILKKMGGWTNDQTREKYQDEGRIDLAAKTADVRSRIRPKRQPESGQITPPDYTTHEA